MTVKSITMSLISRFYWPGESHASSDARTDSNAPLAKPLTVKSKLPVRSSEESRFLQKSVAQIPSVGIL